jgi:dimethylargininase
MVEMAALALTRGVPDSFAEALVLGARPAIDVPLARRQHAEYRANLAEAGYEVRQVPADEAHPDCVFIEDTAVIVGRTAVITRSGAPGRRGEAPPVHRALPIDLAATTIEGPGTLDGGDVFTAGDVLYVGRSRRTNDAGIDQLRAVASDNGLTTTVVVVHDALHLKSAVLPLDSETVMVTPDAVDETALVGLRTIYEVPEERHQASALPLRDGTVLVTAAAPLTTIRLAEHGFETAAIDVSELQAADGGLTCMSILI